MIVYAQTMKKRNVGVNDLQHRLAVWEVSTQRFDKGLHGITNNKIFPSGCGVHHNDVTWASWPWRLEFMATRLCVGAYINENIITERYWPFVKGIHL